MDWLSDRNKQPCSLRNWTGIGGKQSLCSKYPRHAKFVYFAEHEAKLEKFGLPGVSVQHW